MTCPHDCTGYSRDRLLFAILTDDVQEKAKERIGRVLTQAEMRTACKGIESGLGEAQWMVIEAAIDMAVELPKRG